MIHLIHKHESAFYAVSFTILFAVMFGIVAFAAHRESKTYNRLTGSKTTWFDDLWVELRVEGRTKP